MKATASKLRPWVLPEVQRHTLANGLTLHLMPRGPLPLVAVRLHVRGGSLWDEPGKLGLADFAASLTRRGAAGKGPEQLGEEIDFVGASLDAHATEDNVVFSLKSPSKHLDSMLEVLAQVSLTPDYPEKEVEMARRRLLAQLANDLDEPEVLADIAVSQATWGDHPYGHELQAGQRDLKNLALDDLKGFSKRRLNPETAHLFVVGDIEPDQVVPRLEKLFGGWSNEAPTLAPVPPWAGLAKSGHVVIVDKPEQTQVQVRIVARGPRRGGPEHFALKVMNTVLGESFTSRLMREIRVKRGLTYTARSAFDMLRTEGQFTFSSFTKTESIKQLLDVALGEVKKMKAKGPTPVEVETAKRFITGLYPSKLETIEALARGLGEVQNFNLPEDWIERYRDHISAVTVKQAAAAAREHLFDSNKVIVLVGNAKELEKMVSAYGEVSVVSPKELE